MFDKNLMKLEGMKGVMSALVLIALMQAASIIGQAWTLSHVLANLWAGESIQANVAGVVAFFACFGIRALLVFARDSLLEGYSKRVANQLHGRLVEASFNTESSAIENFGSAVLSTSATEGVDDVQRYVRIVPPKMIEMAVISVALAVFAFTQDWPSGVILVVMFPVIVFFMVLLGKQARARAERQYATYNRLSNHFLDTLRGVEAIVSAGAVGKIADEVYKKSEALRIATVRTLTTATLSSAVLDLCATFGVAAVAIMLAFRLMDGSIGLATGLTALVIAPEYFTPIRSFANDFHASLDGKNALSGILEIIATAKEEYQENAILPNGTNSICFSDVAYRYPSSSQDAVSGISFTVSKGEHVAVIGPSGSGKTTIANLASGLAHPSEGTVTVQGRVQYVPQDPYLFHATLAENISFYRPGASEHELMQAARTVGLTDLIEELPDGLMTVIGEGGRGLSGGEAHRVALARILLGNADVLVFDEPTAHLDIETELEMKRYLLPLFEGRTVLFATHRLHWLRDMDRIISVDEGHLAEIREGGASS